MNSHIDNYFINNLIRESGAPIIEELPSLKHVRPSGLTVITVPKYVRTLEEELLVRRAAAQLMINEVIATEEPALWNSYTLCISFDWRNNIEQWKTLPICVWVGWGFRGLNEYAACVLNDAFLHRLMNGLCTIVTSSIDPMLVVPRWHSDRPVLSGLRKPTTRVRVHSEEHIIVERKIDK